MKWAKYIITIFAVFFMVVSFHQAMAADDTDLLNQLDAEMATDKVKKTGSDLDLLDELETKPVEKKESRFKY
jgi:hypothetical protein